MRTSARLVLAGTIATAGWLVQVAPDAGAGEPAAPPVSSDFDGDGVSDLAVGVPFEGVGTKDATGAVQVLYGSPTGVTAQGDQLFSQDTAGVADVAEPFDQFGFSLAAGDYDGDGFADLAIGAPGEDVGSDLEVGVVHVLYGSAAGLVVEGSQRFTQNTPGVADAIEGGDRFGTVAAGDVNGDGVADLVIGAPDETVGEFEAAGAVHVLFGGAGGLSGAGSLFFTQDSAGIEDEAYHQDRFGVSVAVGDVNGDGFGDLAVGALGEDLGPFCEPGSICDAGAVHLLFGSAAGTLAEGSLFLAQGQGGVRGAAENGDLFGASVAAGDLNGDAFADLAIGAFAEDIVQQDDDAGAVHVLFGEAEGLSTAGDQYVTQNTPGVPDRPQVGDRFGTTLAIGNLVGDAVGDLAVGVPGEDAGGQTAAGMVHVFPGSPTGIVTGGGITLAQGAAGVQDGPEEQDAFGVSLAIANLGKGRRPDLAVGTLEGIGAVERAGAVAVLYGRSDGAFGTGDQLWHQAVPGIADTPGSGDFFGFPVAAA